MKRTARGRRNDPTSREWNTYTVKTEALSITDVKNKLAKRREEKELAPKPEGKFDLAMAMAMAGLGESPKKLSRKQAFEIREAKRKERLSREDRED